jgi:MurNAc alpha-1-phosphate uridylyltransferase
MKLKAAGISHIVINHAWLGSTLESALGSGDSWGVSIDYSPEDTALGTAGGIVKALPKLKGDAFIVVSGDIYTAFDYRPFLARRGLLPNRDAHLVLVDDHRVHQDFDLATDGQVIENAQPSLTYGNIGLFRRTLFDGLTPGLNHDLGHLIRQAIRQERVTGERFTGRWDNVGTPADLARVNAEMAIEV